MYIIYICMFFFFFFAGDQFTTLTDISGVTSLRAYSVAHQFAGEIVSRLNCLPEVETPSGNDFIIDNGADVSQLTVNDEGSKQACDDGMPADQAHLAARARGFRELLHWIKKALPQLRPLPTAV